MKTAKRVLAAVLAIMMLAMMIPFAVSAAEETYSLKVTSSKEGFEFGIYQVASLDIETGAYTTLINSADLDKAVKEGDSKAMLAACDALDSVGAVFTYKTTDTGIKDVTGLQAGIYYVRKLQAPETVTSVTNRVIPVPIYQDGKWSAYEEVIDLATKINVEPVVTKQILDSKETPVYTTAAIGEDVKFELKATVTGTVNDKLASYAITDVEDKSLDHKADTFTVSLVRGDKTTALEAKDFKVVDTEDGFRVELSEDVLNTDDFYGYSDVVVTYFATLNDKARIGKYGNPNSDGLEYVHKADAEVHYKPGNTVYVFTIQIEVTKVDAADGKIITLPVSFGLFDASKTKIAESETTTGVLTFKGLDQGTYYVQETKEPKDYTRNTSMFKVVLDPTFAPDENGVITMDLGDGKGDTFKLTVENSKTVLPPTGGSGNVIFAVIGGSLILCAGALLAVVLRKRSK